MSEGVPSDDGPLAPDKEREGLAPGEGALPNLVVIGAMKCGTTSLHLLLDQHPDIAMSQRKEISFFSREDDHRGVSWYKSHFNHAATIRGESSPSYTKYPQRDGVPARMHALLPGAKLIYILRDPIERTISHYLHEYLRGRERRPVAEALRSFDDNPYVSPSLYYMQLERYLQYYPSSQILILTAEDLRENPDVTLGRVVEYLGVASFQFEMLSDANVAERRGRSNRLGQMLESRQGKRVGRRLPRPAVELAKFVNARMSKRVPRPALDDETKQALAEFLSDDVGRLRSATHMAFDKWSL